MISPTAGELGNQAAQVCEIVLFFSLSNNAYLKK
jgi:hypothetical protein